MVAINVCILAAVAVIVFCAILPTTETLFGGAKFPVAMAVTLLGVLGLLKEYSQQRTSLIDTILVPYQALFISVIAFFIVAHVIRWWSKTLVG